MSKSPGTQWQKIDGELVFVSVGSSGVWGVNSGDQIFYRTGTYQNEASPGTHWVNIKGGLTQISSGTNVVWGVNKNDYIYIRTGISSSSPQGLQWNQISGLLKQVHVSSTSNQVWGVNSKDYIYRRTEITASNPEGKEWQQIDGELKCVSVGPAGVWGVNKDDQIFYRTGTAGDEYSSGTEWARVSGSLKQISSGNGEVWGVNSDNQIFFRRGLSAETPQGSSWQLIEGSLRQVYISSNSNQVWGVNEADSIYQLLAQTTTGIKICSETNLTGEVNVYNEADHKIEAGKTTCHSIQVYTGEWLVYNQEEFQGPNALLPIGINPDEKSIQAHSQNGSWDNQVRSLRPVQQNAITLYDMNFYCGHPEVFRASDPNVDDMQECRSIIVRGAGKWEVYEYGGYQPEGKPTFTLVQGEYDVSKLAPDKGFIQVGSVQRL